MLQVLKKVAEKHHFDVTQYALATPPEPPSDNPSKLKAAMTVQQLKRLDVMVVSRKKPPKPPQEEVKGIILCLLSVYAGLLLYFRQPHLRCFYPMTPQLQLMWYCQLR